MATGERTQTARAQRNPKQRNSVSEISHRQPPVSYEAEISVLGSILLLPDICDEVVLRLRCEEFYDDANKKLYEHMTEMHGTGQKIDLTLLRERLISAGDYDLVGGAAYLAKVVEAVATPAHAIYYANIVSEKATYRSLINAATEIIQTSFEEGIEAKEALSQAEQRIFSILDSKTSDTVSPVKDVLVEAMDRIDARMRGEVAAGVVDTGFSDLDAMTGGMHAAELLILAARPSMGKTAFAMNISENVLLKSHKPVFFVSLEMSSLELI